MGTTVAGRPGAGRRAFGPRGHRGVTALELLVVVGILAILAAVGMPALLGLLERSRLDAGASELVGALRRAQALAVSEGGYFRVHFRLDANVGCPNSHCYRIECNTQGGSCNNSLGWPGLTDTKATHPGVVTDWVDLFTQYRGVTVDPTRKWTDPPGKCDGNTINWITYNSRGAFVDPSAAAPACIPVKNLSGATRTVVAQYARGARVQ